MDLVTHVLFGNLTRKVCKVKNYWPSVALLSATVIPDFGEIIIQSALAKKFNARFAVYDARTSDIAIASDLGVTWFYDLFHSFFFALSIFIFSKYISKSKTAIAFSIGLFTHIFLDCATHGKIWALKLFFPVSNKRFEIATEFIGNWWDWKPSMHLPFLEFPLPILCFGIWIVLLLLTIIIHFNKTFSS